MRPLADTVRLRWRERLGGTLLGHCGPAVRRRLTVVGLLATIVRFAEFQSTGPDRYGTGKGSRSVYARRRVETTDRIPPARM